MNDNPSSPELEVPVPGTPEPEVPVTDPPEVTPPLTEPPSPQPPEVEPPPSDTPPVVEPPKAEVAQAEVSSAEVSAEAPSEEGAPTGDVATSESSTEADEPTPAEASATLAPAESGNRAIPELSPAACAARLAELFPAVFTPGAAKPLKLRIQADVQQRSPGLFSRRVLSGFLQRYTTSTAYLKALSNAPERIDLDGAPAGPVSDEHRQAAVDELARRRALHDARRTAERDAQREAQKLAQREAREAQRVAQAESHRQHEAQAADDAARRDRAVLLRSFETSTLTKANFCALKRMPEAELDTVLAQARTEREQRPPAPPRFQPPHVQRPDRRPSDRPSGRPSDRPSDRPAGRPPGNTSDRPPARSDRPDPRPDDRRADRPTDRPGDRPAGGERGPRQRDRRPGTQAPSGDRPTSPPKPVS